MIIIAADIALNSVSDIFLRLLFAVLAGGLIGLDRESQAKAGGLRTHMLVSLGAALFAMVPLQLGEVPSTDALSRVIQGVAAGIGFVGAGEIVHQTAMVEGKWKVKGLTSAAAIWLTAALGVTAGCGLFALCLFGSIFSLLILDGAKRMERLIPTEQDHEDRK